jgi:hypothetical protein
MTRAMSSHEPRTCLKASGRESEDVPRFCMGGSKFAAYFNSARPDQGLHQRIPDGPVTASSSGPIVVRPFLGGLHHDYRRAA